MVLNEFIASLLQRHNCVIVPEFGGFIANYKSATIDAAVKRIHPPSKSILFNPNLLNNDGLLGNEVAKIKQIEYPAALTFIAREVSNWKQQLQQGERLEIAEIGFLYKQNGVIVFEQNREVNILLNAFGLASVSFLDFSLKEKVEKSPLTQAVKKEVDAVVIQLSSADHITHEQDVEDEHGVDPQIIPITSHKKKRLKYLAVAVAIPFMFYSYWIPMETNFLNTGKIQGSDFNPLRATKEQVFQSKEHAVVPFQETESLSWEELTNDLSANVEVYNYQFSETLFIPILLKEAHEAVDYTANNAVFQHHLIAGCFSLKNNANSLVDELSSAGFTASILDYHNGLYRVSAKGFTTLQAAESGLNNFKSSGKQGWILTK